MSEAVVAKEETIKLAREIGIFGLAVIYLIQARFPPTQESRPNEQAQRVQVTTSDGRTLDEMNRTMERIDKGLVEIKASQVSIGDRAQQRFDEITRDITNLKLHDIAADSVAESHRRSIIALQTKAGIVDPMRADP